MSCANKRLYFHQHLYQFNDPSSQVQIEDTDKSVFSWSELRIMSIAMIIMAIDNKFDKKSHAKSWDFELKFHKSQRLRVRGLRMNLDYWDLPWNDCDHSLPYNSVPTLFGQNHHRNFRLALNCNIKKYIIIINYYHIYCWISCILSNTRRTDMDSDFKYIFLVSHSSYDFKKHWLKLVNNVILTFDPFSAYFFTLY